MRPTNVQINGMRTTITNYTTTTGGFNLYSNQSINQSNLVFVKRRLNKVLRGASYE